MKRDDSDLLGVVLYRTPPAQRIRALAAAVHARNRRLSADLLIAARDLEARQAPRIIVTEITPHQRHSERTNHGKDVRRTYRGRLRIVRRG